MNPKSRRLFRFMFGLLILTAMITITVDMLTPGLLGRKLRLEKQREIDMEAARRRNDDSTKK